MAVELSCCAWALEGADDTVFPRLAGLPLDAVDIRPSMLRRRQDAALVADLGLQVACAAASHEMPEDASLVAGGASEVEAACQHLEDAVTHAAGLGARYAYVVPEDPVGPDPAAPYAAPLARLADHAASLGVRVCVEHFPGSALPTVEATLDWLDEVDHPNLFLLFDIGHAVLSGEDVRPALTAAGDRLGYVHLDDNDGAADLHWALTDGVLDEDAVADLLSVLDEIGYSGPVSLEMKPDLSDPFDAIRRSAALVRRLAP